MVYFIVGENENVLSAHIKKIKKDKDFAYYDLKDTDIEMILDDCNMISIFMDKRVIIVKNIDKIDKDNTSLLKYLKCENEYVDLILCSKTIDKRKKIIKDIMSHTKMLEANELNIDMQRAMILKMLGKYKISNNDLLYFLNLVGSDIYNIQNEIEKLMLYKNNDFNITKKDIDDIIFKTNFADTFSIVNNMMNKNYKELFISLDDVMRDKNNLYSIIPLLFNQFLLLYQVKILLDKNKTKEEIASILSVHPYRVKLSIDYLKNYDVAIIRRKLNELIDIDLKNKTTSNDVENDLYNFFLL